MKRQIFNLLTIMALTVVFTSCKKKADEANTSAAEEAVVAESTSQKYIASVDETTITWKGFKPTGTHSGTIALDNGVFTTNDGKLHSGTFLINMASLKVTDIPAEEPGNGKLAGHLKSADFFDVEKFPNAAFEVTGSEDKDGKTMLSGNLSLKGVENNITFPVTVSNEGDMMSITSEAFTIDRSKWNVKYGSKSFFDDLGDKFINDEIELQITVKAKKS